MSNKPYEERKEDRPILIRFNDGKEDLAEMTGTNREILVHFIGQWFEDPDDKTQMHYGVSVEFLDEKPNGLNIDLLSQTVLYDIASKLGVDRDFKKARQRVSELSPAEAFECYCEWHGLKGWSRNLIMVLDELRKAGIHK